MADEPTPGELSRRINDVRDEVRTGMTGINERLDRMPTNDLLGAYLAKTDGQVEGLRGIVGELKTELSTAKTGWKADLQALEEKLTRNKQWAVGACLTALGTIVGVLTFARGFVS